MGKMLSRKAVLATKIEAAEGVAETLAGADANILISEPKFDGDFPMYKRENVDQSLSPQASIPGTRKATMTFKVECKGSGSLGTPPALGKLLKACGWAENIVGAAGGLDYATAGNVDNPLLPAGTNSQQLAAAFTSAGETITVAKLRLKRLGTIASGKRIWVEIQTDAAGAPSGVPVVGGVSEQVDCLSISTVYGLVTFSFPGAPVLAGGNYHAVLRGDYAPSDTLNIQWRSHTDAGGGNFEAMNNGTWADTATKNLEATVMAGTGVLYTPSSLSTVPTLTMALYRDGIRKQMRGCRGSCSYNAKLGEPGIFSFNFQGVYDAVTDQTILTGSGIETTLPRPLLSAVFSVHSFAAFISAISWDQANAMEMRGDVNDASGLISCLLGPRDFKGSIDPEEELVATCDWYGRWAAGTAGALTWKHPGDAGNVVTFTCPKVVYTKQAEAARGTIAILNTDFQIIRDQSVGDDEMVIEFA